MKGINRKYSWYAIYTKSRSEKKLHQELLEQGIVSYLPLKKELRVWSDRKKWVEMPLFSSYVFVRVSLKEYYTAINSTYAVCYVTIRGKAVAVPDRQIEALKILLNEENKKLELVSSDISVGEEVEVLYGPLKGVCAEIVEIRGKHRLLLRFGSLGCCVHAEISLDLVKQLQIREESKVEELV